MAAAVAAAAADLSTDLAAELQTAADPLTALEVVAVVEERCHSVAALVGFASTVWQDAGLACEFQFVAFEAAEVGAAGIESAVAALQ